MFATYSLNIRRLLSQSIRRRPNLHLKSEHLRIIAENSLAVRENCSRQCIFFRQGTHLLDVIYILTKFNENIVNGHQVMESTRMLVHGVMDRQKDRQHYAIMKFFFLLQNVRIKLNN